MTFEKEHTTKILKQEHYFLRYCKCFYNPNMNTELYLPCKLVKLSASSKCHLSGFTCLWFFSVLIHAHIDTKFLGFVIKTWFGRFIIEEGLTFYTLTCSAFSLQVFLALLWRLQRRCLNPQFFKCLRACLNLSIWTFSLTSLELSTYFWYIYT